MEEINCCQHEDKSYSQKCANKNCVKYLCADCAKMFDGLCYKCAKRNVENQKKDILKILLNTLIMTAVVMMIGLIVFPWIKHFGVKLYFLKLICGGFFVRGGEMLIGMLQGDYKLKNLSIKNKNYYMFDIVACALFLVLIITSSFIGNIIIPIFLILFMLDIYEMLKCNSLSKFKLSLYRQYAIDNKNVLEMEDDMETESDEEENFIQPDFFTDSITLKREENIVKNKSDLLLEDDETDSVNSQGNVALGK